ncbi:GAF domain-containing sensor histidine kinase [Sphingobacterium sp.]|uniref:GAF domain-containing sensor histidine kinase n=1 Tax=Sphingobacterium sp. TaxID=341027 RepID=UPI00289786FE|nr:GAF domain-containing sensor histidine kinase [Sphingobacterium sp.]
MTIPHRPNQQYDRYIKESDFNSCKRILEALCGHTKMRYGLIRKKDGQTWGNWCVYDSQYQKIVTKNSETYVAIYQAIRKGLSPIYIDDSKLCSVNQWTDILQKFDLKSYISYPIINKKDAIIGHLSLMNAQPVHFDQNKLEILLPVCSDLIAIDFKTVIERRNTRRKLEQELNYSKNRELVLSSLAHDLNNPVSIVKVISQYLQGNIKDENQKSLLKKIEETSFRMKGIIDDVLDFSSIGLDYGFIRVPDKQRMDSLIRQILTEFELLHNITLIANINLPIDIPCDHHKMGRAFTNLIGNAIKHGNPQQNIEINAFVQNENFIFSVTNEISYPQSSDLTELFKPFVKGTNSNGLGLGLFIANEIAKIHKGKITVNLEDNKITFNLIIPLHSTATLL